MELEVIMLSKISQIHKDKYCIFSLCGILKEKKKDMKAEGSCCMTEGQERGGGVRTGRAVGRVA